MRTRLLGSIVQAALPNPRSWPAVQLGAPVSPSLWVAPGCLARRQLNLCLALLEAGFGLVILGGMQAGVVHANWVGWTRVLTSACCVAFFMVAYFESNKQVRGCWLSLWRRGVPGFWAWPGQALQGMHQVRRPAPLLWACCVLGGAVPLSRPQQAAPVYAMTCCPSLCASSLCAHQEGSGASWPARCGSGQPGRRPQRVMEGCLACCGAWWRGS